MSSSSWKERESLSIHSSNSPGWRMDHGRDTGTVQAVAAGRVRTPLLACAIDSSFTLLIFLSLLPCAGRVVICSKVQGTTSLHSTPAGRAELWLRLRLAGDRRTWVGEWLQGAEFGPTTMRKVCAAEEWRAEKRSRQLEGAHGLHSAASSRLKPWEDCKLNTHCCSFFPLQFSLLACLSSS